MRFDFRHDYFLENDRVKLMPLSTAHLPELHDISLDPDIWTYFLEKGQGGLQYDNYMGNALAQRSLSKEYPFVIFDKQRGHFAGMTRLYAYDAQLQSIKLGHSWYGKDFRGTGINKHCKYLIFEFVFEQLMLERIGFGAYATNVASVAAMKSVGCQQEGVLRNLFPSIKGNGRTDCVLYSILREEWLSKVKVTLEKKLRTL